MNRFVKSILIFVVCSLVIVTPSLRASWTDNGVPVCTASMNQETQVAASDGAGGVIIAWVDNRGADRDIYAQRIDASGKALWAADGIPVCIDVNSQHDCAIVSDGTGGAIIVWEDMRDGVDLKLYAQRVSSSGLVQWGPDGILLSTSAISMNRAGIVSDGANGAIVAWEEYSGVSWDIYSQRISSSGAVLWTSSGTPLCTNSSSQYYPGIVSDEAGGAVVCWRDERNVNFDVYVQRVDASGNVAWALDGVETCLLASSQFAHDIAADGAGGAIVVWSDYRSGMNYDIYAQRIDDTGAAVWTPNGISINTGAGDQDYPGVISDGAGGGFIVWVDPGMSGFDLSAQKVDEAGTKLWTSTGVPVVTAYGYQSDASLVSDGKGGILVSWRDNRSGAYDIYAQRIGVAGEAMWAIDGVPLCVADRDQNFPVMVEDGNGGGIATWKDSRSNIDTDIYTQQVDSQGRPGYRAPDINSVLDVPGDEGGWVNVTWHATPLDYVGGEITDYSVWRALETSSALNMIESGSAKVLGPSECLLSDPSGGKCEFLRTSVLYGETFFWELVSTSTAYQIEGYSRVTETRFDSTAVSTENHYFQIIAHTTDPGIFYVSAPDSGYSVDNISPCPPLALAGEQLFVPAGLELTWAPNIEPDLDCYNIYRDIGPTFDPSAGNLLTTTCDTLVLDGGWSWDAGFCYKVAAVDIHGNESEYAVLCAEQVTGDDPMPLPDASFLSQNYPNPFNPNTTIAFGLKSGGFVNLSVYDAAGRLVAELIDESRPAGQYATVWNGKGQNGSSVASGVYFYRLITNEFEETKKMILLR